jgi:hypothetical protein
MNVYALVITNERNESVYIDSVYANEETAWDESQIVQETLPEGLSATVESFNVVEENNNYNA